MREYTREILNTECNIDDKGVYRWKSSDNVPPTDILEGAGFTEAELKINGLARDHQITQSLLKYAEAQKNRSDEQIAEERFEARAAMGPGVDMVNVVTGEKWTT
jgi:hypothetical protein